MDMGFREALAVELDRRKMTQRALAQQLDVVEQLISMWMNGDRLPSKTQRVAVAKFLRVNLDELGRMMDRDRSVSLRVDELEAKVALLEKTLAAIQRKLRRGA